MHLLFVIAHYYPVMAIPAAMAAIQLALHFKRQKKRPPVVFFTAVALAFLATSGLWIYFRGDLHAQHWMKNLVETFSFPDHH